LDCEMCFTQVGLELTRVTVVDVNHTVIYDEFVVPENPIVDYNTRYSGITAQTLEGITRDLSQVQREVLEFLFEETILVGHSLENDLLSLKIVHKRVIDTAVLYPHKNGDNFKFSLRFLAQKFLSKSIQENLEGHDSKEDASTALELVQFKLSAGEGFFHLDSDEDTESLFSRLRQHQKHCAFIAEQDLLNRHIFPNVKSFPISSDTEVKQQLLQRVHEENQFVCAQFVDLSHYYDALYGRNKKVENSEEVEAEDDGEEQSSPLPTIEETEEDKAEALEILKKLDQTVKDLHEALPANSVFFVAGLSGPTREVQRWQMKKNRGQSIGSWTDANDIEFERAVNIIRQGVFFSCVK